MEFRYDLLISELHFNIQSPKPIQLPDCFRPFAVSSPPAGTPDIFLEVFIGGDPPYIESDAKRLSENVYILQDQIVQRYHWRNEEYIVRIDPVGRGTPCRLYIPAAFSDAFCANGNWLNYLALERLMISYRRVILHASAILYKGKAYLFTAPSGGGKSTHAALWEQYFGAEIMNGDKVVIQVDASGCKAFGSPVAGSSGIFRNIGAPIAAVFLLRKSCRNCISTQYRSKNYVSLYSEAVKSVWDMKFNRNLLDLLEIILETVPIFTLECTPEKEAVQCVLDYMERIKE